MHTWDEAVGAVGFDGGLLGIDDAEDLDVVLGESEAGEVAGKVWMSCLVTVSNSAMTIN